MFLNEVFLAGNLPSVNTSQSKPANWGFLGSVAEMKLVYLQYVKINLWNSIAGDGNVM